MIAWLKRFFGIIDRPSETAVSPLLNEQTEAGPLAIEAKAEIVIENGVPSVKAGVKVRDLSAGYALIKEFESLMLKAYPDPATGGKPWTIGWGTTVYPSGSSVKQGDVCTRAEAQAWFEHDCARFIRAIEKSVTVQINDNQFGALLSFTYNLGEGNLRNSTLLKRVNVNAPKTVIEAEFMKWVKANGKVMNGLIRRRKMEAALYNHAINPVLNSLT